VPDTVVAAGKAAASMFAAARTVGGNGGPGVVATHPVPSLPGEAAVACFDCGHPTPNDASVAAAARAVELARSAGPGLSAGASAKVEGPALQTSAGKGGLLVLLSGGASAMLAAPVEGITLADKIETAGRLMRAGAAIHELNCVRKHLSRIKGGRLAAAAGRTITLALSDVHAPLADDPSVIGSGPTVPDETTFADAVDIVTKFGIAVPRAVAAHLERGRRGDAEETVKPGDPRLHDSTYLVIGNRQTAVDGARRAAEAAGYAVVVFPEPTTGEARVMGREFVERAAAAVKDVTRPVCVIGSGETTVTVRGSGQGGRNQEFALAGVADLPALESGGRRVVLASAGTDGIDGPTDAAGAVVDSETAARGEARGLDWRRALENNDAYHFAAAVDALLMWGPTGTNVGDLHVLLLDPSRASP
jgi:glycerate-2-kinase